MQSSAVVHDKGDALSQPGYAAKSWYTISVPSTVLAGLVANGEYPDVFVGDNLSKVPTDRVAVSWWYRRELTLPALLPDQQAWLYFKGINYRANIWLNGKQIAMADQIVGTYRDLELDITAIAAARNALAIEVFAPDPKRDLTITFVDWAPAVPDRNMGVWQDVLLCTSGPVTIRNPFVQTDLDVPTLARARITVMADLSNAGAKSITGTLSGRIGTVPFTQDVTLDAGQTRTVSFTPQAFGQLAINNPRIWWPWQLGEPQMYGLELTFTVGGQVSDRSLTRFGIRKVTSRLENGHRLFSINGIDLLILGGGYAPDLFQRRENQQQHIRYLKDMNLNTVRLEGKLEDDAFYDLCDEHGILVMAGWCCCSPWEQWKNWKDEQHKVAMESLRYQIRRARTHPSMLVWLNGSDNHPPAAIEKEYLAIESELNWPCPILSSASAKKAAMSEPTGVKMEGPYQWEPPIFWMTDTKTGGAWGFNTEVGPGPIPPPLESLQQMLPPEHRWPIDKVWDFHCGREAFGNINTFKKALDVRFGPSQGIADFSWKAQAQAYETIRAMYEAFRRNKFTATGHIQWMLNNAWPSLIWHLYDYYLRPGAAYFATKLACRPVHVLYSYDNQTIVVANDTLSAAEDLQVSAEVYAIDATLKHRQTRKVASPANRSVVAMTLAQVAGLSATYFLRLTLTDAGGKTIDVNSYWLSTKPDVLGENGGDDSWNLTPCVSFADYTLLATLPKVELTINNVETKADGDDSLSTVTVVNSSQAIAMMVRTKITKCPGGEEVLPVRWDDNYFMLLPRESRTVTARYAALDPKGASPAISADCFNNGRDLA
jgi:exo-1,4-beta-D-glucosaminidase